MKVYKNIVTKEFEKNGGCYIDHEGDQYYFIPYHIPIREQSECMDFMPAYPFSNLYLTLHREDGPAVIEQLYGTWWAWYGEFTKNEKEWLDPEWRRRAEIKGFL